MARNNGSRAAPAHVVDPTASGSSEEEGFDRGQDSGEDFTRSVPDFLQDVPGVGAAPAAERLFNWESPHPSKATARLDIMAPMATCQIPGATQWYVERLDMESGRDAFVGMIHIQASHSEFIQRFQASMPTVPGTSSTFFLYPCDTKGTRLGAGREPYTQMTVAYENVALEALRRSATPPAPGALGGTPGTDNLVLKLLTETIESLKAEAAESRRRVDEATARADAAREAALEQRMSQSNSMVGELSTVFQKASEIQSSASTSALESQRDAAKTQRELEAEDRRARREEERAAREEERRARKEEMDLRVKAMEIDADLKREAMKLEAEQLRIRAQEERDRITQDRIDAENRRRDEREADRERRTAEDNARREHEARMETIRITSEEREAERAREYRAAQERLFSAQLALVSQREEREAGHKLGALGELLDLTGMTPMTLIEKGKELLTGMAGGGEGGIGVAIVQGITELGKEIVRRLPEPDDQNGDDADDEEEEEDAESPEDDLPPQAPEAKPRRQLAGGMGAALTTGEPLALPAPQDAPPAAAPAERVPVPVAPTIPLVELRAGRGAVEAAVRAVSGRLPGEWPELLAPVIASTPLISYLTRVGVVRALAELELDRMAAESLTQTLIRMGHDVPLELT